MSKKRSKNSYLPTELAKQDLIHYVAVNGENYENYLRYAEQRGWQPFSRRYLHTWVGRNRREIQVARQLHIAEVRKVSTLTRQARLAQLEKSASILAERIQREHQSLETDELVRLMEQQRKQLQAVAQERGEWNSKDDGSQELSELHVQLLENMQKALRAPDEGQVVEGEVREL